MISLPCDGDLASATTITRPKESESNICREIKSDSFHQAPCNSVDSERSGIVPQSRYPVNSPSRKSFSSEVLSDNSHSRSVTPGTLVFHIKDPYLGSTLELDQTGHLVNGVDTGLGQFHLEDGLILLEEDQDRFGLRLAISRHKPRSPSSRHRHSRYSRYHRSRSGLPRHRYYRSRSPMSRSISPRSRSLRPYRYRQADLRRERLPRSRSVSIPRNDPVVSTLTELVEHQGQLLKELSRRLDHFLISYVFINIHE